MTTNECPSERGGTETSRRLAVGTAVVTIASLITLIAASASSQTAPTSTWSAVNGVNDLSGEIIVSDTPPAELRAGQSLTETNPLRAGTHQVAFMPDEDSVSSATSNVTVDTSKHYLFTVRPSGSDVVIDVHAQSDEPTDHADGRLTLVHAGGAGTLTAEIFDRDTSGETFTTTASIAPGDATEIGGVPQGRYHLVLTTASGTVIYNERDLRIKEGVDTTAIAVGDLRIEDQHNIETLDRKVGSKLPPNVNLVNAFDVNQRFDITVDGQRNRSGVEGTGRSGMIQDLAAGTHTIGIRANGSTGPAMAEVEISVEDGGDYDLAIHPDPAGNVSVTFFANDNSATRANTARMTVRHLAASGPLGIRAQSSCVNVSVPDDQRRVIIDNGASHTFDELVPNSYEVDFFQPGTSTVIASGPDIESDAGVHQVVYIMSTDLASRAGVVKGYSSPLQVEGQPLTYNAQGPARCGNGETTATTFPETTSGGVDEVDTLEVITLDPRFNTAVGRLYAAVFERQPDEGGFGYWTDRVDSGLSLVDAAAFFADSPEYRRTYGNTSDAAFLDALYRNVFARTPDPQGERFWLDQLSDGKSRAWVIVNFSESPEFKATVSS